MTSRNPVIVESLGRIRAQIEAFADAFYAALYARAPQTRALFDGPETERRKLGAMLAVLGKMRDVDSIEAAIRAMGTRHATYGVALADYPVIIDAFLDAAQAIDADLGEPGRAAWRQMFESLIAVMSGGHAQAPARTSRHDAVSLPSGSASLYRDLGGDAAVVERVHQRFYDSLYADDWLGGFFAAKSKESLIFKQTRFMVAAFGGPDEYVWESPAIAHMHMMVSDEQADIRETLLRNAIRREGLSQDIENRWLATDQSFRPAIVKRSEAECVMRCPGQIPVAARKPSNYQAPQLLSREQAA